jgi:cysteine sulfinate desulfinase/cysteine desulfurase-like protein
MSLYENIAKKRARIKAGGNERMRRPGSPGAPTAGAFKAAAKTAKKKPKPAPKKRTAQ